MSFMPIGPDEQTIDVKLTSKPWITITSTKRWNSVCLQYGCIVGIKQRSCLAKMVKDADLQAKLLASDDNSVLRYTYGGEQTFLLIYNLLLKA